jgi:hypothetical protein
MMPTISRIITMVSNGLRRGASFTDKLIYLLVGHRRFVPPKKEEAIMKKQVRLLLYVIFFTAALLLGYGFQSIDRAWAGPDHQTVPTATLDLTEAASDLVPFASPTPETGAQGGARARVGLIVVLVVGALLLLGAGTVFLLYTTGVFSAPPPGEDRQDQEQGPPEEI